MSYSIEKAQAAKPIKLRFLARLGDKALFLEEASQQQYEVLVLGAQTEQGLAQAHFAVNPDQWRMQMRGDVPASQHPYCAISLSGNPHNAIDNMFSRLEDSPDVMYIAPLSSLEGCCCQR